MQKFSTIYPQFGKVISSGMVSKLKNTRVTIFINIIYLLM